MHLYVTGSDGFIGTHLCVDLNNRQISYSSPTNATDISEVQVGPSVSHIIHLAGVSQVDESWKSPFKYLQTNVLGTAHVLEQARKVGAKVIFLSSYVYGPPQYLPIDEEHIINSFNPYCLSKNLAEQACQFYATNYSMDITIIRPFNIYGKGQHQHFLIPQILYQLYSGQNDVITLESITPRRDYLHVTDLVDLIIKTIDCNGLNVFNAGSGQSYSVSEIYEIISKYSTVSKKLVSRNIKRKNEVVDVIADCSHVNSALNWRATTTIETGLKELVESMNFSYHRDQMSNNVRLSMVDS